jgi:holo-[acyl-carrier protein] synthase
MIGIDIVSISRIERMMNEHGEKFLVRFLNDNEMDLAKSAQSIAGLWAAKEATSKALGSGIGQRLSFHDMTVTKSIQGSPFMILSESASEIFKVKKVYISITHDGGFSAAVAFTGHPSF